VDDGSPEAASEIVRQSASAALQRRIDLYRIQVDIPWNRGGARNLGTYQAQTDWVVHVDIDHVLSADSAKRLLEFQADPHRWYRFERYRNGRADETRRKDKIPDEVAYGKIHPHIDSYLCTRDLYWAAGGYNEDFSGCLGGGSPFLAELERASGRPLMAPPDATLSVYTRDVVPDASDHTLSRDRAEFSRRKAVLAGKLNDLGGEAFGAGDVAGGQIKQEGAFHEHGIVGIQIQCAAEEVGGDIDIAVEARGTASKIGAGERIDFKACEHILRARGLRGHDEQCTCAQDQGSAAYQGKVGHYGLGLSSKDRP
jgi:hypothetical protein